MSTVGHRRTGWIVAGVLLLCTGGVAVGVGTASALAPAGRATTVAAQPAWYGAGSATSGSGWTSSGQGSSWYGEPWSAPSQAGGSASSGLGEAGQGSESTSTAATTAQQTGVVVIDTVLAYDQEEAAGTGIVLTSSGEILTNNHVVEGATSIRVTVPSTGRTYTASVVGTDATDDVAVLQLQGASGLATAALGTSADVAAGDAVTAVGNAGGTGSLVQASGTVTGTDASITTQAEESVASESLHGLIETDADIQAGDSGGPLYDNAGEVVGIDTAASTDSTQTDGYAIPIRAALSIAEQIETGQASSTVTIGSRAFLGVALADTDATSGSGGYGAYEGYGAYAGTDTSATTGAQVAQVYAGTPAATTDLAAGDVITAVDGTAVSSADDVSAALARLAPGDTATISWVDATGAPHSAVVTLTTGPAA